MSSLCTLLVCLSGFSRRSGDSSRASCHHVHVQWRKIWCKVVYWWQTTFQKLLTADARASRNTLAINKRSRQLCLFCLFPETWRYLPILSGNHINMYRCRSNEDYRDRFIFHTNRCLAWACKGIVVGFELGSKKGHSTFNGPVRETEAAAVEDQNRNQNPTKV